jgi:hypothetical protein
MPIQTACPVCNKVCSVADTLRGQRVRCPGCREIFVAGAAETARAEPVLDDLETVEEPEQTEGRLQGARPAPRQRPAPKGSLIPPPRSIKRGLIPPPKDGAQPPPQRESVVERELKTGAVLLAYMAIGIIAMGIVAAIVIALVIWAVTPAKNDPVPAQDVTGPAKSDQELTDILTALKAPDPGGRAQAAERLLKTEPNIPRRAEVAAVLAERLRDQHAATHTTAARALVLWATRDNVPALIEALGHESNTVRVSVLEALGILKDDRAVAPVAAQLRKANRQEASKALQRMGPMAETEVGKYLSDKEKAVRVEACRILQAVGTKGSVAALEAVRDDDPDSDAKAAAKDALAAIHARGDL